MDALTLIGIASCGVTALVCGWLVIWCQYNDGIVGKLGLSFIALSSGIVFLEYLDGVQYQMLGTSAVSYLGLAVFFVRHWWRRWGRAKS